MMNYHTEKSLTGRIDNVLKNIYERNPVKLRNNTPDVLVNNGVTNLPMYENPSHVRKNILTEQEARDLGITINSRDHYHSLGKDLYIKIIIALDDPRAIFKNKNEKDYLILTTIKDKNKNNVLVPIEIETITNVNKITIEINRIKSVYGYNITKP